MKIGILYILGLALLGSYAAPAMALQTLCLNSPENPTAILGLLGAAAGGYPWLRQRLKHWRDRKSRNEQQD